MPSSFSYMKLVLPVVAGLLTAVPAASYAKDSLNEKSIESFYERAAAAQLAGEDNAIQFLRDYMSDDLKITLHMTTHLPDMEPQTHSVTYNKDEIIENTRKGYDFGSLSDIQSEVLSVNISRNGETAKVQDRTYSLFNMNRVSQYGNVAFTNEQSMYCDAVLVLNSSGVIQSKSGVCNVEVTMTPLE